MCPQKNSRRYPGCWCQVQRWHCVLISKEVNVQLNLKNLHFGTGVLTKPFQQPLVWSFCCQATSPNSPLHWVLAHARNFISKHHETSTALSPTHLNLRIAPLRKYRTWHPNGTHQQFVHSYLKANKLKEYPQQHKVPAMGIKRILHVNSCCCWHHQQWRKDHRQICLRKKQAENQEAGVWKSWRGLEKTPKAKKLRVLSSSGLYLDKFDAFTGLKATLNGEITCEHISAHAEAAAAMAHDRSPNICDFCGMHQCFQNKAYVNDILPYISLITVSSMSATFHLQTSSNKIFYQPDTRVTSSSLRTSATPSRSVYDLMQRCRSLKWRLWWSQFSYAHLDKRCVKPESFIRNGFLLKFRKWHPPATSSSIKDSPARLGQFLTLSSETDWRSADIPLSKKRSPLELLDFLWILLDLVILKYNRLNKWLDELTVHLHPDRCKQYSTWKLRIHG